jgi:hypothetical protein
LRELQAGKPIVASFLTQQRLRSAGEAWPFFSTRSHACCPPFYTAYMPYSTLILSRRNFSCMRRVKFSRARKFCKATMISSAHEVGRITQTSLP